MPKVIEVIEQAKIKSPKKCGGFKTVYADLVKLDDGWYAARIYDTSKAKKSYGVSYGVVTTRHHSGEERIVSGNEYKYNLLGSAEIVFKSFFEDRPEGTVVTKCRKKKLLNWFGG